MNQIWLKSHPSVWVTLPPLSAKICKTNVTLIKLICQLHLQWLTAICSCDETDHIVTPLALWSKSIQSKPQSVETLCKLFIFLFTTTSYTCSSASMLAALCKHAEPTQTHKLSEQLMGVTKQTPNNQRRGCRVYTHNLLSNLHIAAFCSNTVPHYDCS